MRLVGSMVVSAAGAWLAGTATAVIGLSALQSRLPAVMTRIMDARPDVDQVLVLLGTGPCAPGSPRAEALRAELETEHGMPVVYVDLTVPPGASARAAAQARELARGIHADFVLEHSEPGRGLVSPAATRTSASGRRLRPPAVAQPRRRRRPS